MPTTETKLRRGTATQCNAFTGAEAEVVVDTTNDRLRVHDGLRAGGFHVPNHKDMQQQVFNYGTVGGTANAITLTSATNCAITGYALPLKITFKATATNTGAVTVNVDGIGVKNIYQVLGGAVVALTGGEIVNGGIYDITYDGVQFQLVNGAGVVVPTSASTTEVAAETATDEFIRPDRLKYAPGAAKAFAVGSISTSGSVYYTTDASYNGTFGSAGSGGRWRLNFSTPMKTTNYLYFIVSITGTFVPGSVTKTTGYIELAVSGSAWSGQVIIFEA